MLYRLPLTSFSLYVLAVIIAHTAEGQQQGNANKAVDSIAKYLEGSGY